MKEAGEMWPSPKKRPKRKRHGPVFLALGGLFLVAAALGIYGAARSSLHAAQQDFARLARQAGTSEPSMPGENQPSPYEELQKQNGDLAGWVRIAQTAVDYPVMQTLQEPEYYLRRNFEKEYSIPGTPFLDAACEMENSPLLIIYGHNMNDGSMFSSLQGYLSAQYRNDHPIIRCDSLTQAREYEVVAVLCFRATEEASRAYYTVPQDEHTFTEYVERLRQNALYGTGLSAVWGDQLLALSTCDKRDKDKRILVIAKKMPALQ